MKRQSESVVPAVSRPIILRHLAPATVSEVYESYWRFAAERQAVFSAVREERRGRGQATQCLQPTSSPMPTVRLIAKSVSYSARHLSRRLTENSSRSIFPYSVVQAINKIGTWELLEQTLGAITFDEYVFDRYDEILTKAMRAGCRIYSAAYIMPPGVAPLKNGQHQNHLLLLERMMADHLPERLAQTRSMQEGFEKLRAYPTLVTFLLISSSLMSITVKLQTSARWICCAGAWCA